MSASRRPQFLIAEFARHCRLPVSTLRYYDRLGLLRPAEVDPSSGYRRYSADQLPAAITIARLRAIGTSPENIARILAGGEKSQATLTAERRRITAEMAVRAGALARLDALTRRPIPGPASLPQLVDLTGSPVSVLAFTAGFDDLTSAITRALVSLRRQLRRHGVHLSGWGALLPLDLGEHVSGHVFARTGVPEVIPQVTLDTTALPAGRAIRISHEGSPDDLAIAYSAALTEIGKRRSRPAGPVIEDYPIAIAHDSRRPRVEVTVPMIR